MRVKRNSIIISGIIAAFILGSVSSVTLVEGSPASDAALIAALNEIRDAILGITPTQTVTVNSLVGPEGPVGPAGTSQAGSWAPNSSTDPNDTEFVKWDIEIINTDTSTFGFTAGADNIVIKQAGTYLVTASVESVNVVATEGVGWTLEKNSERICIVRYTAGGSLDHSSCTVVTEFAANDLLRLLDGSTTNNIFGDSAGDKTILSVVKLS